MASTPIPAGSSIVIDWMDSADTGPEGQIEAYLVNPPPSTGIDETWINLGNSFGAKTREHFVWMAKSMAEFHHLPVYNNTNIK